MIRPPVIFTIASGSSRNFRSNTRPAIGMATSDATHISDSTMPRSRASSPYLSSSSRLNCDGMAMSAKPRTPTPVARK